MNKVILLGKLTRDPEIRFSSNGNAVCKFTIAVNKKYKKDGESTADFINCIAYKQCGEFIGKYFSKGRAIAVSGSLNNNNYTDSESKKHYQDIVTVTEVDFADSKKNDNQQSDSSGAPEDFGFMPIDSSDDLPF